MRSWLIGFAGFVIGVAATFAGLFVTTDSTSRMISSEPTWYSYLEGKQLVAVLSEAHLADSPAWRPGAALPLSVEEALRRAQAALGEAGMQPAQWQVWQVSLEPVHVAQADGKFIFVVTFQRVRGKIDFDSLRLLVYMNGAVTAPSAPAALG